LKKIFIGKGFVRKRILGTVTVFILNLLFQISPPIYTWTNNKAKGVNPNKKVNPANAYLGEEGETK